MLRRRCLRIFFCVVIVGCPTLSLSAAEILTSNNPEATISTSLGDERLVELEVSTTPSGAAVSLNGRPRGVTPVRLPNLPPGLSILEVEAPGYETTRLRLRLRSNESVRLEVPLRRETGILRIDPDPSDAELFLAGERLSTGEPVELPTGTHLLQVRRFGYQEQRVTVVVEVGETQELRIVLPEAPFAIELRGNAAASALVLRATAPGTATVTLRQPDGSLAFRRHLTLDSPATPVFSPGELPPGEYRVTVSAEAATGDSAVVLSRELVLAGVEPVSSLLYVRLPASISRGNPAVGSGWVYIPNTEDAGSPATGFLLSASLGLREDVALSLGATALLYEAPERNRLGFSLGGLWRLWETDDAAMGLGGRATVDAPVGSQRSYRPDYFGTPEGVFLSVPGSVDLGPVTLAAAPEAGFTWRSATWTSKGAEGSESLALVGSRVGALGRIGPVILGLSGRISWSVPGQPNNLGPTTQLGAEARLVVPRWGASISPFFALAGPYHDIRALVGFSVVVGEG